MKIFRKKQDNTDLLSLLDIMHKKIDKIDKKKDLEKNNKIDLSDKFYNKIDHLFKKIDDAHQAGINMNSNYTMMSNNMAQFISFFEQLKKDYQNIRVLQENYEDLIKHLNDQKKISIIINDEMTKQIRQLKKLEKKYEKKKRKKDDD